MQNTNYIMYIRIQTKNQLPHSSKNYTFPTKSRAKKKKSQIKTHIQPPNSKPHHARNHHTRITTPHATLHQKPPTPNHHTPRWRPTTVQYSNNHQPTTNRNHQHQQIVTHPQQTTTINRIQIATKTQ